ncbi:MAG: AraC family transcriptional regulator [Sporocytophaga sp.]|uniref:helix-turn-helix domain-containing protein n=1 Tax=Sporocytophaga sp. TaxID=2231183 RepID=UPI001B2302D6|nr:helix-turn-helix domain-containing protein [Sporocytophaga sp.]MBO9701937.1 AraC family transcriptional regulator [Sporocytophaga sp.]
MQHQEFEPPKELKDAIQGFWYTSIDFEKLPSGFEVLPDGYAEIIFHFGSDCSISYHGTMLPLPSPFLIGLLEQPVHFHGKGHLQIIGIKCFPWAVFDMLGLPASKESVRTFEHPIAQLHSTLDHLVLAGKIREALTEVKQYFLNVHSKINTDSMLIKAGMAMREATGTIPVGQIAAAAHSTIRTLERNFKRSSGHTIKDVSALIRFEQVRNQLFLKPDTNLAGLAYELGYTDQSHLSKEFKRFSGITPAAFARKAKKA